MRPVRADVVAAAIEVFREKGYERATVREIAGRAGLGTSSLYFHIRSKEELCLAAVRPVLEVGAEWMEELVARDEPPLDKLRAAIVRAVELYDLHPEAFIYLSDFFPIVQRADPELTRRPNRAWEALVRQVLDDQGAPPGTEAKLLTYGIMGMFSWMHRWYRPGGRASARELGNLYADLLVDGLRAREPAHTNGGRPRPGREAGAPSRPRRRQADT